VGMVNLTAADLRVVLAELDRLARIIAALPPPPEQHGESPSDRLSVPAEATSAWAVTLANIRQGQSSTPRCEPPGEADIASAANMIRMVLRAALILTGKEG
jgi:hypothetical protein